ncbi:hypothetical protein D3C84_1292140 [compost metagenome]
MCVCFLKVAIKWEGELKPIISEILFMENSVFLSKDLPRASLLRITYSCGDKPVNFLNFLEK